MQNIRTCYLGLGWINQVQLSFGLLALAPGSWQASFGLGSMSRYSAHILICITYIHIYIYIYNDKKITFNTVKMYILLWTRYITNQTILQITYCCNFGNRILKLTYKTLWQTIMHLALLKDMAVINANFQCLWMRRSHNTVKPVCNDHLYIKLITCDLFSNVLKWRLMVPSYLC